MRLIMPNNGYDPMDVHDFDFQDFDDIVQDELSWSIVDSLNCRWKSKIGFPYTYKRKTDNRIAYANKKGASEIIATKKFTWVKFDNKFATQAQKDQWAKDMKAVAQAFTPTTALPHPGSTWTKKQTMPYLFKRLVDNKNLWANRAGFDYLVKNKQYKFIKFDATLATTAQKKDWEQLSKLLAQLAPVPTPKPGVSPELAKIAGNYSNVAKKGYPYTYKNLTTGKISYANRPGWLLIQKDKNVKFVKFDKNLATSAQQTQYNKDMVALLPKPTTTPTPVKAPSPVPVPAKPLALPHPDTKWMPTQNYPWAFQRISDKKGIHAGKAGFDYLIKRTSEYKFIKFKPEYATTLQKQQWTELSTALAKLAPTTKAPTPIIKPVSIPSPVPVPAKPLALPHPDTKWMPTQNYPWAFQRISDKRGIHAGKAGFDYLVKRTNEYKFIKFKPEYATTLQKQQWVELSTALARLAPTTTTYTPTSKGMAQDILDIKKMLEQQELERQATAEHKEISETQAFRQEVLARLMRIAEAVLTRDHPVYQKILNAR